MQNILALKLEAARITGSLYLKLLLYLFLYIIVIIDITLCVYKMLLKTNHKNKIGMYSLKKYSFAMKYLENFCKKKLILIENIVEMLLEK